MKADIAIAAAKNANISFGKHITVKVLKPVFFNDKIIFRQSLVVAGQDGYF